MLLKTQFENYKNSINSQLSKLNEITKNILSIDDGIRVNKINIGDGIIIKKDKNEENSIMFIKPKYDKESKVPGLMHMCLQPDDHVRLYAGGPTTGRYFASWNCCHGAWG